MNALLLTILIFAYWGLVGFAILSLFSPRQRILQGILLSPSVGIAVVLFPVFFLSRAGLPVGEFSVYLLLVLAVLSALILAVKRPAFPVRKLTTSAVIVFAALMLACWPMLEYGLNWVSYANDDMANYCLGAARFLTHGFFDAPDLDALYHGRDYSQAYWYLYVPAKVRPGSELMLAFVWGSTGFNAHQVFMPVIMALNLALVSAVGGMVTGVTRNRKAPLIAMSLMAVSPLTSLGSLYQLIGQVGGLALLVPSVSLLLRVPRSLKPVRLFVTSVPAFLTIAGIFVWYPEVLPFLGLGWFIYAAIRTWQDKKAGLRLLIPAGIVGILLLLILQGTLREVLVFLLFQASMAGKTMDPSSVAFPYMLVPSGISMLWGISPMGANIGEPLLSAGIALGLALTFWFLWKLPQELRKASPPAIISFVMLLLAARLFAGNVDFGLFKLAMFIQPFLIAVVAMRLSEIVWAVVTWRGKGLVVGLMFLCLSSQTAYVKRSTGEFLGSMTEIPQASGKEMNRQFAELLSSVKSSSPVGFIADTSHLVMAKYQALYSIGTSIIFPSKQFFQNISGILPSTARESINLGGVSNSFRKDKNLTAEEIGRRWLLIENEKYTPFNAYRAQKNTTNYFTAMPMDKVRNHLTFIHSDLGIHYYFLPGVEQGDRRNTAFFPIENDPLFAGNTMNGMGRYILMMDTNPTPGARMVMEATSTVMKNFESALPLPIVYGESAVPLQFIGRGSGRIFSPPVQPALSGGLPYLSIDMGRDGKQFQNNTTGLMKLYGSDIVQDTRRLTTFARDISLISQEDYLKLTPPTVISRFPADLANRNLEYSGIYEDGWVSERAFFTLSSKLDTRYLLIKGMVPQIDKPNFRSTMTVSIDGKEIVRHPLGLGNFELKVPVSGNGQRQRVDLAFDRHQVLPGADLRPAGGKIDFIGFVSDGAPK
jgi:hypothetical protein